MYKQLVYSGQSRNFPSLQQTFSGNMRPVAIHCLAPQALEYIPNWEQNQKCMKLILNSGLTCSPVGNFLLLGPTKGAFTLFLRCLKMIIYEASVYVRTNWDERSYRQMSSPIEFPLAALDLIKLLSWRVNFPEKLAN